MKISPKFEIKCDKCGSAEIVGPDREDTEPRWPDDWLRISVVSPGGGAYALCGLCKKSFWAWVREQR